MDARLPTTAGAGSTTVGDGVGREGLIWGEPGGLGGPALLKKLLEEFSKYLEAFACSRYIGAYSAA